VGKTGVKIGIAPNEDGLGTSAWVVGLAKELARQSSVSEIAILVATDKTEQFHKNMYRRDHGIVQCRLRPAAGAGEFCRIELATRAGAGAVDETIERCILKYPDSRTDYWQPQAFKDLDLLVDFGVPQLVRAVFRENLRRRWSGTPQVGTVTVLDHAWSLSLQRIVSSDVSRPVLSPQIRDALEMMRADEALTDDAILFAEPICPTDFHAHWRVTLGRRPEVIPGVLGGPLRTLAYVNDSEFGQLRSQMVAGTGVCPPESYERAREYARQLLGIEKGAPQLTLFVSGGGTPVWDEILGTWVKEYESTPPRYNVVIFSPTEARKRYPDGLPKEKVTLNGRTLTVERGRPFKNVTFIGCVDGETHHPLFGAFDLVLTRAGGGTVNDALAFQAPLMLVEEPGMWQVEQIRQCCMDMKLANTISFDGFEERRRKCVESKQGELRVTRKKGLSAIPNHGEFWLAKRLLSGYANPKI
jgi:hypothetical protein